MTRSQRIRYGSQPLRTLFLGELRMLMRDRRTIIASVVLPLVFLPIVFFLSSFVEKKREKRIETQTFHYAVVGTAADAARALLDKTRAAEEEGLEPARRVQLEEMSASDYEAARTLLDDRELHAIVRALTADEARALDEQEKAEDAEGNEAGDDVATARVPTGDSDQPLDLPRYLIVYQGDWDPSDTAADALRARLREGRTLRQAELLEEAGFPIEPDQVAEVKESQDLATAGQRGGRALGRFGVGFLMLFLLTGGSIVAADSLAGEKERGTLETLLTSAATRTEIVFAKLLVIITVGLVISLIQVANLLVYVGLDVIDLPENMAVAVSPLSAAWILLLLVPLAVLVAAALLLASGRAKSYKEFQVNFFPVMVILLAPAAASVLPGIDLRSAIVLVPIANVAVAVRELLVGEIDWLFLPLTFLVSSVAAWQLVRWTMSALQTERLVTGAELDEAEFHGGPGLFRRRVLVWFGVIWVTIFLVGNVSWMQEMRRQVLFNVVFLFGIGSLLLAKRYGLDFKQAFAFRRPSPWVWPAVILGAPATLITSTAIIRLSNFLFPVPERMLEAFGRQIVPQDVPFWQILLLITVAPGICEELAFRGVLLHGLRKRFAPWQLVLVTSIIFGLFHMSLFRILPTASLGVVLAVVTLLTGSIFPAMLWHAVNNGFAILMGREGIDITALDWGQTAAAAVVTVLVFALLWRTRRVYPDLKGARLQHSERA